jgi:DNA polymerase (family 10)
VENAEIARLFRELADLLDIEGANPFRVRAYRTAARTVENHPDSIVQLAAQHPDQLTELPGIGEDLAAKIGEIVRTGHLHALEEAAHRLPRGLPSLMTLPGLGPKRVRTLFQELGVHSPAELREACRGGKVTELPGFGPRLQARLLQGLSEHRESDRRFPLATATQYAEALLEYMQGAPGLKRAVWAGSLRRRKDTVGDLDLLVTAEHADPVTAYFLAYPEADQVIAHGSTRAAIRLRSGLQVDLRILEAGSYGAGLYYFTGSKAHNIALRRLAQARGLKVNEYGVWQGGTRIAGRTEREVARAVGLPLIPPELREDRGEIEAARRGELPHLVSGAAIRGDLQCHTTASDGRDTLEEMARAAAELHYQYLAITDHSPHLKVTHGLDPAALRKQRREIERINEDLRGCTILAGCEVDILPDGRLDLDDETLWSLDLVVVALHSSLALPRREQTRRVLRALSHPAVDVLAHPTGRLVGRRAGAALDLDEIARAAADRGIMLEVNAQPERLDLDDVAVQTALRHGVRIVISTDAHATAELGFMRWGVDQARRGWATARDVANCLSLPELRGRLHAGRQARHARANRAALRGSSGRDTGSATRSTRRAPDPIDHVPQR